MNIHEKFISRAIQIAKNSIGNTYPNPAVGVVITVGEKIIGEGFTSPAGQSHAEVNAIKSVKNESLLRKATLYTTLEPCSHYGKTPPCSDLIIKKGIPKVVIGTIDPHHIVAGRGIERLKKAGCEVHVGVLDKACKKHHQRFLTVHRKKRPYTILKWAESRDKFIAPLPFNKEKKSPVWISNIYSRQHTHFLRAREHAILVGTQTALLDNPNLTVRNWTGNQPIRVIIDKHLQIPLTNHCFSPETKTIILNYVKQNSEKHLFYEQINRKIPFLEQYTKILQKHQIQSIIIEGGAVTLQNFIEENLWDEIWVYRSKNILKTGIKAPKININPNKSIFLGEDILDLRIAD